MSASKTSDATTRLSDDFFIYTGALRSKKDRKL